MAKHLPGHDLESVGGVGWKGTLNGMLLDAVEAAGFNAMITNDKQMDSQQRLLERPFGVQILSATN